MKTKRQKTFTIAELAIAIMILGGALATTLYSYLVFLDLAKTSKNISLAARVASAKLEDIRSDSFDDIDLYANQVFYPQSGNPYPQDINFEDFDYRGIVYVTDISIFLKQVTVIVCWRQGQRTIGEDWVFETSPDPTAHAQPATPVVITTLMASR